MLAFWSCEGVVFLVLSSSSHFTVGHVFPFPLSGANWRSLSLLWGSGPPFPNMAPPFTGSAHTPFPGSKTIIISFHYWMAKWQCPHVFHISDSILIGHFGHVTSSKPRKANHRRSCTNTKTRIPPSPQWMYYRDEDEASEALRLNWDPHVMKATLDLLWNRKE